MCDWSFFVVKVHHLKFRLLKKEKGSLKLAFDKKSFFLLNIAGKSDYIILFEKKVIIVSFSSAMTYTIVLVCCYKYYFCKKNISGTSTISFFFLNSKKSMVLLISFLWFPVARSVLDQWRLTSSTWAGFL